MMGLSSQNAPNEIGPSSPKGRGRVARRISSKNVMSSKQAESLQNNQYLQRTSPSDPSEIIGQAATTGQTRTKESNIRGKVLKSNEPRGKL